MIGHLDAKPYFDGMSPSSGELNLKIKIENSDYIWLFGNINSAIIYLDPNVPPSSILAGGNITYTPTPNKKEWPTKTIKGKDALHITDLPFGTHVLSVKNAVLTHLITWP